MKKIIISLFFSLQTIYCATYNLPADIGTGAFSNCSFFFATTYQCTSPINLGNNDTINLSSDMSIINGSNFTAGNSLVINTGSNILTLTLGGIFDVGNSLNASTCVNVEAGGDIDIGNNGSIAGTLQSNAGTVTLGGGTVNTPCGSSLTSLMASWQFDECVWDGSVSQVIDSSGNDYHGTSVNADTSIESKLCRSGDFSANGTSDYVILDNNSMDGLDDFSMSVWLKTSNSSSQAIVSGARSFQANEALMWFTNSTTFRPYVKGRNIGITITDIADNNWHHFVWTRSDLENCAYLDGALQACKNINNSSGVIQIDSGGLILAQEQDSVGGSFSSSQDFEGFLDELKIYDGKLDLAEVQTIYNNESSGNNYDGTSRVCNSCGACGTYAGTLSEIQFVGDQITLLNTLQVSDMTHVDYKDNYIFSENPVIFVLPNTRGGNPANMRVKNVDSRGFDIATVEPQGEDGGHLDMSVDYFAINVGSLSANSGSQVYNIGSQLIEVGYIKTNKTQKGYDIGSNDWETITPKGNFCNPVLVTQIQGMVNEPNYDPQRPSIPFLTVATQINGQDIKLALERSETNLGTVSQNEVIAYMISEANIQDSFVDDAGSTIAFETIQTGKIFEGWDDSAISVNFVNTYVSVPLVAASVNSRDSLDGGWFRKQTHTNTRISLVVDEDRLTGRSGGGSVQDGERSKSLNVADGNPVTPELGGIFVFDGTFILTGTVAQGSLNAVNVLEKDIFDGNISTQVVGSILDLALVAREDDNVSKRDADIVKLELVNCVDNLCLDCTITSEAISIFDNLASPIKIEAAVGYKLLSEAGVSYSFTSANKIQKLRITELGKSPTCSFDTFSTRPDKYQIGASTPVYAGENFILNLRAIDSLGGNTLAYNESDSNNSFIINYAETRPECDSGETLVRGVVSFNDGASLNVDANYSGLAVFLNISILENIGNEFALIDADDTSDTQRLIQAADINISVLPYELNVTLTQLNSSTGLPWLYMADVNEMNVSAVVRVQASNKNHDVLQDFNSSCYAQDVDVKFKMIVKDANPSLDMNYTRTQGSFLSSGTSLADINQSLRISSSEFISGVAQAGYALNVDRGFDKPTSPFNVRGLGADILSTGVAKLVYHDTDFSDGNFSFYYGRLHPKDISTSILPVSNTLNMEVYAQSNNIYVQGLRQNTLFWYLNEPHNTNNEGSVIEATASSNSLINNLIPGYNFSYNPVSLGQQIIDIDAASNSKATIHLKTKTWLWYVPSGFGSAYDDGAGSDCTMHPCFQFSLNSNNTSLKVQSGAFNGTIVPDVNRSSYNQTGVKLFR